MPSSITISSITTGRPQTHLSHLDGLRGLAALWVLLAHCMIWGGWTLTAIPQPKLAVDVFMVLSGFLMVYQWYAKSEEDAAVTLHTVSRFYVRRYFRIAPLFYVVLLITFAAGPRFLHGYDVLRNVNHLDWTRDTYYDPLGKHLGLRNLLMHVTFLFGLFPNWAFSDFLPDWSISLEMQFYAAFPLLLLAFRTITPYVTALLCGLIAFAWHHHGVPFPEPSFLPIKLYVFLTGMLLAEAVRRIDHSTRDGMILALLGLAIPLVFDSIVVATASALVFFLSLNFSRAMTIQAVLRRIFGNRLMKFLADASYCVYLIHGLFISLIGGAFLYTHARFLNFPVNTRVALLALSTLAGSYLTAWLLHHLVERPGIALGRTLVRRIPTRSRSTIEKEIVQHGVTEDTKK